jgi:hypothetical protein
MLRRLLAALLFVLPAQFLWAAVAPHCAHEAAPASFHVGHHAHKHHSGSPESANAPEQADRSGGTVGLDHPDCGFCHASAAQFDSARHAATELLSAFRFAGRSPEPYSSRVEQNIDRPKWTHTA